MAGDVREEDKEVISGPKSLTDGFVYLNPGFCTRLTDYTCYVWSPGMDYVEDVGLWDDDLGGLDGDLDSLPLNGFGNFDGSLDFVDNFNPFDSSGFGWNGSGLENGSNMTDQGFDDDFFVEIPEKKVAYWIYVYMSPIFLVLGSVCNLFSVLILLRLANKVLSTCAYLALLAVLDTFILYTRCGNDWLREMAQIDITYNLLVRSQAICKAYPFFFNFLFHLNRWLIVCVAIEGLIATKFAHKVYTMCTLSRSKANILLLTVILVCVNVHFFWSFELVSTEEYQALPDQEGFRCTFNKHGHQYSEEFQMVIWPILDLLLSEIMPLTVVIVCTIVMVVQIAKGKHRGSRSHQAWRRRYILDPKALDELKVTLMFIGIFYPILTLPKLGYNIFNYLQEKYVIVEYDFNLESKRALAHATSSSVEYSFFAFKFVLYVTVSRKFRREFISLLRCKSAEAKLPEPEVGNDIKAQPLITPVRYYPGRNSRTLQ